MDTDTLRAVTRHRYMPDRRVLAFELEGHRFLYWGFGPMPGTDVYGFRFVMSQGFADRSEYLQGQKFAHAYARDLGLGYKGVHDMFKACEQKEGGSFGAEAS